MILLENIQYINWNTFEITKGNIWVEEGTNKGIKFVNKEEIAQLPQAYQRVDGTGDDEMMKKTIAYKENLKQKIVKANQDLSEISFKFRVKS